MIAMIEGVVKELSVGTACVLTNSGVGYEVELSLSDFCELSIGQSVCLWTHLVVREDAQILCGFLHKDDKDTFKTLIKISGVGLKMALAILSTLSRAELYHAVEYGDETALTRVAGVGKKTAQRLMIELKDKLGSKEPDFGTPAPKTSSHTSTNIMKIIYEVEMALVGLGYKEKEAKHAISLTKTDNITDTQSLLKACLKQLSGF